MKKEQIKEITQKLEQGVADVFTSDNFRNYLATMAKFHTYSLNNQLLIWMQKPDATRVAGYKSWQTKFHRQVRKGETGIKILAPIPCKYKKEVQTEEGLEEKEIQFTRFKAISVFDISQTDGEELPDIVKDLDGAVEGYDELVEKLQAASPVPVGFEDIKTGAKGYYHILDKRIAIQSGMSEVQTIKTMVHEIAHSILHDKEEGIEKDATRNTKECQAESVAYVVSQYLGLDTSDYSFGYVAGWSTGKDIKELRTSLEVIRATAEEIIQKVA